METTTEIRKLTEAELETLAENQRIWCPECGREDDNLIEQSDAGTVYSRCDCGGHNVIVPMAEVEKRLKQKPLPVYWA